jgi:hypothetical protein
MCIEWDAEQHHMHATDYHTCNAMASHNHDELVNVGMHHSGCGGSFSRTAVIGGVSSFSIPPSPPMPYKGRFFQNIASWCAMLPSPPWCKRNIFRHTHECAIPCNLPHILVLCD